MIAKPIHTCLACVLQFEFLLEKIPKEQKIYKPCKKTENELIR